MAEITAHEAADLFPMLGEEELGKLAADIEINGLRNPIVLYRGEILDGRNRLKACELVDVEPRFEEYEGADPVAFVISTNLHRRHLSPAQLVAISLEALPMFEAEALERRKATEGRPSKLGAILPQESKGERQPRARDKVADTFGVSPRYVSDGKRIKAKAPELIELMKADAINVPQAKELVKLDADRRAEIVGRIERGEAECVSTEVRRIKERAKEQRRRENAQKVEATAADTERPRVSRARYATIVADPPWSPSAAGVVDVCGRSNPAYATLDVDEIAELEVDGLIVSELADEDAHLYLWTVNRTIEPAFRVLEAWGFRFVTMLTWCKPSIGMGNYFRNNTEHVLFGVRGSQRLKTKSEGTWFEAPRGPAGHSSKPEAFYDLVDRCSPGPVLELFSRRERSGWVSWGEGSDA